MPADQRIPVLYDTDIGTNVDDAVALSYLLRQPRCELLGVTTVSGDVARRAACAEVVCAAAGRADVPIYAGASDVLLFGPGQPDVPHYEAIRHRPHRADRRANAAVDFLRAAIRQRPGRVTLLTTGPFTNVALLFALDPELPALLRRVVSMAGHYGPDAQGAETNCRIDPVATAITFAATGRPAAGRAPAPHFCIGLDVTRQCRMPAADVRERFRMPPLDVVLEMAEVFFTRRGEITFHDPLAASTIFRPQLCSYEAGSVSVDVRPDSPAAGNTTFASGAGNHHIARTVDPDGFFREFFSVFG